MLLSWTRGNYFRVGGANQINYGQLMVVGLIKSCINGKTNRCQTFQLEK